MISTMPGAASVLLDNALPIICSGLKFCGSAATIA